MANHPTSVFVIDFNIEPFAKMLLMLQSKEGFACEC